MDLSLSGFGDSIGIVPELLLIDTGYSFQSGFGEDSAINGQKALLTSILEKAKLEDAKGMLAKGYPVQDIVDITGLPLEKIEALK